MKYIVDHDIHIHSQLSLCSADPEQNKEALLEYAVRNKLKYITVTDHFWDSTVPGASNWYQQQNYLHSAQILPLPQNENVRFYFGCETDFDKYFTVGISRETIQKFDFVIVPTTHMHMPGFTRNEEDDSNEILAKLYVERVMKLLSYDLPFEKMGLAHITCRALAGKHPERHLDIIDLVSDESYHEMFSLLAEKGMGLELNFGFSGYKGNDVDRVLRPYRIAKECGAKFYLGSDAHHPAVFEGSITNFENITEALKLTEDDKFIPSGFEIR